MSTKANKVVMCEVLMEHAENDKDIVVLCSDSRGSASMSPFAERFPEQFVEVGIAEQNLVGISAGMARCGKKAYAISPASFLSTRSYEQVKVDCAYSDTNVKLVGISGGISYGALGMTHHSVQDIAAMAAIPGMRVYLPSDSRQSRWLFEQLLLDEQTAYIRMGRNAVEDVYQEEDSFAWNKAVWLKKGSDVVLAACGEMVRPVLDAAGLLEKKGISCSVLDMYCVKPLDTETLLKAAAKTRLVVSVEEHSPFGGLGSMISQCIASENPQKVITMSLPDAPVVTGTSKEVFDYYGLNTEGIAKRVEEELKR